MQQSYFQPGDNLVVENIPPIPASIAEEVAAYSNVRAAAFQDWHPDRREMLVITRFADAPQVHLVKMPGGARTQLTFYADRVSDAQFGPASSGYFVFHKDAGGGEWHQYYRYDLATGKVTLLTDGKSRNTSAALAHGDSRIAYSSTRRTGQDTDIWVLDAADPTADRILVERDGGGWFPADWSPDNRALLVMQYISVNESYIWLLETATGEMRLLTPRTGDEPISYGEAVFSKDGKGVYATTDQGSEYMRLACIDLDTHSSTCLSAGIDWDIDGFALSPDGRTAAFTANEDGISRLYLLDTATRGCSAVAGLPDGVIGGLRFHANSVDLGFTLTCATSPDDSYSLNAATRDVTRWTFSETGGLDAASFAQPRLVKWESFDGRSISGFLYRPDPLRFPGKRPVIVNIHGGPESQMRPVFLARVNYYMQELGVAMLFPNVRGSSGYGKTFLQLDNGCRRDDTYKDIAALLDWIAANSDLDGERIMVTGGSYGGHMTWAVSSFYGERICCSLPIVGPSNLVTLLENTEAYRRDLRRVEYGDERDPDMRAYLERIAPLNNAEKIRKPVFAVAGKNDPRVPWTESRQMVDRLAESGTTTWFLMANDEGHGFAKKRNQDFQFYATIMFVRQYLLRE